MRSKDRIMKHANQCQDVGASLFVMTEVLIDIRDQMVRWNDKAEKRLRDILEKDKLLENEELKLLKERYELVNKLRQGDK